MIVVLDTSAAAEIALRNTESSENFREILIKADWVIAPTLLVSEASNMLRQYYKFGKLSASDCEQALEFIISTPDELINEQELYREAFKLSYTHEHPAYDMMYLVLARRNNALLISRDKQLLKLARKLGVDTSNGLQTFG